MKNILLFGSLFLNREARGLHSVRTLSNQFSPKKYCGYNRARNTIIELDNIDLYTGKISKKKSIEHIWPQSYFISDNKKNIRKDMHILVQIDLKTNIFRSNYKFTDDYQLTNKLIKANTVYLKDDMNIRKNLEKKIFFLPDRAKGVVSRSIAYSILVYPELKSNLEKIINREDLIKWCTLYPVTDFELEKNNIIKYYQGNENPFIIDPELILLYKNI